MVVIKKIEILEILLYVSVTIIEQDAFRGCTALTSVIIPSSTYIGQRAFPNINSLTITIKIEEIGDDNGFLLKEHLIKLFPNITVEIDNSIYENLLLSAFYGDGPYPVYDYENTLANNVIRSYLLPPEDEPEDEPDDGYRKNKTKYKSIKKIRKNKSKKKKSKIF